MSRSGRSGAILLLWMAMALAAGTPVTTQAALALTDSSGAFPEAPRPLPPSTRQSPRPPPPTTKADATPSTGRFLPEWALAVLAAGLLWVSALLLWPAGASPKKRRQGPYRARRLLTPNETEFYGRLRKALPDYVLFSQVSMSAIIEPRRDQRDGEYMRLRAKFAQKYVDFLVCEPKTLRVIAIVELDDVTHDPVKDAARDEMLEGAGYTVVRWHSRRKPCQAEIARTIRDLYAEGDFPRH